MEWKKWEDWGRVRRSKEVGGVVRRSEDDEEERGRVRRSDKEWDKKGGVSRSSDMGGVVRRSEEGEMEWREVRWSEKEGRKSDRGGGLEWVEPCHLSEAHCVWLIGGLPAWGLSHTRHTGCQDRRMIQDTDWRTLPLGQILIGTQGLKSEIL